jgi:hypothetical protein
MDTRNRFYDLWDDRSMSARWHLRGPVDDKGQEVDPWRFDQGTRLEDTGIICFPVKPGGPALDFTMASFSIPVVSNKVVRLFDRLDIQDEVQFIQVQVEGHHEPYFILNTLQTIRCIDDARCEEVLYWLPEDNRPDKLGKYRNVRGLKIDPTRAGGANIFRPWGWTGTLIVSERVKLAMEEAGLVGPRFIEV